MKEATCRLLLALALLVLLLLAASGGAQAQSTFKAGVQVTVKVVPGGMSITSNGNALDFGTINAANAGQTITANSVAAFTITDSSGVGRGWNITLQSSDLSDGTGTIQANPYIRFNPTGGTITATSGQPVDASNGPREVNTGTQSLGSPLRVVSANPGYGQGVYIYTPSPASLTLTIPQGLQVGTGNFSGTMTATVNTGP